MLTKEQIKQIENDKNIFFLRCRTTQSDFDERRSQSDF